MNKLLEESFSILVDKILESIENGNNIFEYGWETNNTSANMFKQYNPATGTVYSGLNFVTLWTTAKTQGYKDNRWYTFNNIKNLENCKLKKGSKGVPIFKYIQFDVNTNKEVDKKALSQMPEDERRKYLMNNVKNVLHKTAVVFNAQCIEGLEKPRILTPEEIEQREQETNAKLETIVQNSEATIYHDVKAQAFYSASTDTIHIPPREDFKSMQAYYGTALHEMAHSTSKKGRVERHFNYNKPDDRAKEELLAEMTALYLSCEFNTAIQKRDFDNSSQYLASWASVLKADKEVFIEIARQASDVSKYMIKNYLEKVTTNENTDEKQTETKSEPTTTKDKENTDENVTSEDNENTDEKASDSPIDTQPTEQTDSDTQPTEQTDIDTQPTEQTENVTTDDTKLERSDPKSAGTTNANTTEELSELAENVATKDTEDTSEKDISTSAAQTQQAAVTHEILERNERGQVTKGHDSSGVEYNLEYDKKGVLVKSNNSLGITRVFNKFGKETLFSDTVNGITKESEYDKHGNLTHIIEFKTLNNNNTVISFEETRKYNRNGTLKHMVRDGIERDFNALGREIHVKNTLTGFEHWREYDKLGRETYYRDSNGVARDYDEDGNLVYTKDVNGYETWRTVDKNGNETHFRDSLGAERVTEYNALNKELHYKDSSGVERWHEYDEHGNETYYRDSNGIERTYTFDNRGKETSFTEKHGQKIAISRAAEYDESGRLIYSKNEKGYEQWFEFDKNGNETHYRDNQGAERVTEYNELNKEVHYRDSSGIERWHKYDENGKETYYRDSDGIERTYTFNNLGNETSFTEKHGQTVVITRAAEYDERGNELHYRDSKGVDRVTEYNALNKELHYKDNSGVERWREYDERGNELHYRNSNGVERWTTYNNFDKVLTYKETIGGKVVIESEREYDERGNLKHYRDSDGTERWSTYNSFDKELTYKETNSGKVVIESEREYDERGNELHYRDSDGTEHWSTYNNLNKELSYKEMNGGKVVYERVSEYDEDGKETYYLNSDGIERGTPKNVYTIKVNTDENMSYSPADTQPTAKKKKTTRTKSTKTAKDEIKPQTAKRTRKATSKRSKPSKVTEQETATTAQTNIDTQTATAQPQNVPNKENKLNNIVVREFDNKGNEQLQEYDERGNLVYEKNIDGQERWHDYDENGNETHLRDSDGFERWNKFDEHGNELHYHNSKGYELWHEYDERGNETHFRNGDGFETWREFDERGNETHVRNSYGEEWWREFDERGNEIHYRDNDGEERWIEYDERGNKTHERNSDGLEHWSEYDENGNEIHYRANNGVQVWKEYDERGNQTHFRNGGGFESWREYDERGNLTHYRDSDGNEFKREYTERAAENVVTKEHENTGVNNNMDNNENKASKPQTAQDAKKAVNNHGKPLVINFFAGPSAGKTTAALELTAALKKAGYNVEYVNEYAKELVLEGRTKELENQELVTDEQFHRLDRLRNNTDIIVTDSPVLLGLVYGENKISDEYASKVRGYHDSFNNFNVIVTRGEHYQTEGRLQTQSEAIELDTKIKSMLDKQKVFYGTYKQNDTAKTVERVGQTYKRLYHTTPSAAKAAKSNTQNAAAKPTLKTNFDNMPEEMKKLDNWVAFRTTIDENGKYKKILLNPNSYASNAMYLKWAKANDPSTWSSFSKAVAFAKKYKLEGLGFSLSGSGMTCIDLDHHIDKDGKPSEFASKFIDAAKNTYIEKSMSGTGVHIFTLGQRPQGKLNRNDDIGLEVYDTYRFIAVTGNLLSDSKELAAPSEELTKLVNDNLNDKPVYHAPSADTMLLNLDDNALIERIQKSDVVAPVFNALMRGEDLCGNRSVTDMKLCNILAFYSGGDAVQVERIFRSSGLYRPKKGVNYPQYTAEKACATLPATYNPDHYHPTKNYFKPKQNYAKTAAKSTNGNNGSNGNDGR